jgi:hypothetical protein
LRLQAGASAKWATISADGSASLVLKSFLTIKQKKFLSLVTAYDNHQFIESQGFLEEGKGVLKRLIAFTVPGFGA